MFDPVDEFVVSSIRKYKEYDFKSVVNADLQKLEKFENKTGDADNFEKLSGDDTKHFSSLLSKMKLILGDKVVEIRESKRLVDSAACLISGEDDISAAMHKIMKMANQNVGSQKKIMEINPNHKLVRNLLKVYKTSADDEYLNKVTEHLYESSLLQEGNLDDPHELIRRMNLLLEESSEWYCKVKNI